MISNTAIKPSAVLKHLGVFLEDSLTFRAHTDEAATSGYKCLAQLTTLRHNHRGLSTHTALHLVNTAFLPNVLWASPVRWAGSIHILN